MDTFKDTKSTNRSADELELLNLFLQEEGDVQLVERIPKRQTREHPPLSFAQERLWFLNQMAPDSSAYNNPVALRYKGAFDVSAMEKSYNALIHRHEALRTHFRTVDDRPVQVIESDLSIKIPITDLQHLTKEEQEAEITEHVNREAAELFDLGKGPLIRISLLRLSEKDHVLTLIIHHIASDGWSTGIIIREVGEFYQVFSNNKSLSLPELPIQYADFSIWQRDQLQGEKLTEQTSYWQKKLHDPPVIELPTDRPRQAVQKLEGSRLVVGISNQLKESLQDLAHKEECTLFMILMTAFKVLLFRYTGQDDIIVGSPIANRNKLELENLIGFFVNMLPLRTSLSGDPSFRSLLDREREVALKAYSHQDVPFEKLVQELLPERDLSRTPLFQVVFNFQNRDHAELNLPGLNVSLLEIETRTAKYDLEWTWRETNEGLKGSIEFRTELFDTATVERMIGHYVNILENIVSNPDLKISDIGLMSEAELLRLLPQNQEVHTTDWTIHQRFEHQVEQTPQAAALSFDGKTLTYEELNQQANQLAHRLKKMEVGPDVLVGICLNRCTELIVGILGILKAGGAYLPLDPVYPKERQEFMLRDANVTIYLTQRQLLPNVPDKELKVICLDSDWQKISVESRENPVCETFSDNLAYVIYTSGSTGVPKGTLISHGNVTRLFQATDKWYRFAATDVWTFFHSQAFDFSVWEIWGSLLYGGKLVIVPYLVSRSPEEFFKMLTAEKVTILNQTPSAFRQLIEQARKKDVDELKKLALRFVIFGGEALDYQCLRPWFELKDVVNPQLINMYGITETTVHVTYRPVIEADLDGMHGSSIGVPLPDLAVYILDSRLKPVPVGVPGEMYVGGAGLSRGYLNRQGLTADRLIPHSFGKHQGERLYRTGDLARWLPDGQIDFMGRSDHQVKIRGFRIELGEIETCLKAHPMIRDAIVLSRPKQDDEKEKQLVAYLVPQQNQLPGISELHAFLKTKQPYYMVPAVFLALESIPLTHNGKLDTKALPLPGTTRSDLAGKYVPPQTMVEEILTHIFANVLKIEKVGIYDNFFALGGDSIRIIQVVGLAKKRGLNLSLQQVFQHQTIHELNQQLEKSHSPFDTSALIAPFDMVAEEDKENLPADLEDAYPMTSFQLGMLYHMELTPESPLYHNVDSFHLKLPFQQKAFAAALKKTTDRHLILRTSFSLTQYSQPLQLVHKSSDISLHVKDISHLAEAEQEKFIDEFVEKEKDRRFDISKPPLLRFHIFQRTEQSIQFTLVESHLILDGWSLTSIFNEIITTYLGMLNNEPVVFDPLPGIAFRDYVNLERQAADSKEFREFWENQLQGAEILRLPRRYTLLNGKRQSRIQVRQVPLAKATAEGLKQFARAAAVPLKTVLITAHLKALSLVNDTMDVMTGVSINGRPEEAGGDKIFGLFLNTLPFRLQLEEETWEELVQKVFKTEMDTFPFRRYPLSKIQENYDQPILETLFNFVHFHSMEDLFKKSKIELISSHDRCSEETNFTLLAGFAVQPPFLELSARLHYDSTELSEAQIEKMVECYALVLQTMTLSPDKRHSELNLTAMLSDEEKSVLRKEINIIELNSDFDFPS